ncbi:sensor histidine kinase [Flocculibacter collagenilyticus]|uniref:sensor histidine kinase n=1 Tax=Flocculibacter collagenilyticus TaxID=2744479 RepID=UPI001F1D9866|nr:histidine kinase [Flocculibacter collagenilyticus]
MFNWHRFIEDRNRFFWILHTSGWAGFALIHYIGSIMHDLRSAYIFVILLNAYAGWLLTLPLRYLYRKIWNHSPWKLMSVTLLASYSMSIVWTMVKNLNYWEVYKHGYRPEEWIYYFKYTTGSFYIILCWSGLYFGIKYYQMLQREKEKALKATTMAHEAQLKMLRYQLNPHFLFNTLNAISTLVLVKDNDTANKMVTRLSEFLRYSLHKDPIKKVPLKQEIQALKLYLEIEKVRFEDRLTFTVEVDKEAERALVPSMILQPLIENSIKYAIAVTEQGGEIKVKASTFGKDVLIEVSDNGPGTKIENGKLAKEGGVGLENIVERLHALYESNFSFNLSHNLPQGLVINIRIPLEQ